MLYLLASLPIFSAKLHQPYSKAMQPSGFNVWGSQRVFPADLMQVILETQTHEPSASTNHGIASGKLHPQGIQASPALTSDLAGCFV